MSRRLRPFHGGPCFRHRGRGIAVGPRGAAARPSPEQGSPPVGAGVEVMGPRNAVACPRNSTTCPRKARFPSFEGNMPFRGHSPSFPGQMASFRGQAALTGGGPAAGPTRCALRRLDVLGHDDIDPEAEDVGDRHVALVHGRGYLDLADRGHHAEDAVLGDHPREAHAGQRQPPRRR